MREMLFRGKRIDNGERVDGESINTQYDMNGKKHIYVGVLFSSDRTPLMQNVEWHEVIPETVGQYTGLTDKNGKKIFEGDIVKTQKMYDRPYSKNRKSKRHIGVVKYQVRSGDKFYNVDNGKWDRHIDYGTEWIVKVEDYGKFTHGAWGDFWDCEVIGNIHDNPELIKEV